MRETLPQTQLSREDQQLFEATVERFEAACHSGDSPKISAFLPTKGSLRTALLRELVAVDIEFRRRLGRDPVADDYRDQAPELAVPPSWLAHLLNASTATVSAVAQVTSAGADTSRDAQTLNASNSIGSQFGRFELRSRLGGGAFGDVYRAYDPKLDREVALKIARAFYADNPGDGERFFREARAAAQLNHPHIVPVYEVGQWKDQAYLVAELIEGRTLAEAMVARRFTSAESVRLVLELAAAVHDSHLKGIFHRDIKPGNVMLDQEDQAHLTDFGLARREEGGESLRTRDGDVLGTPAYMSPEQARGDSRLVDARSDLYSLGVILYELLAGRRPFVGTVFELLRQVQETDPPPLRRFASHISRDLDAVCCKALAKAPADRYQSVEHFAEDLRRWERNIPVEARKIGPAVRLGKWVCRNPRTATGIGLCACLAAAAAAYWQTRPAWLDLRITPANSMARARLNDTLLPAVENGRAFLSREPGRFRLSVDADGFEPQEREVLLVRGRENAAVVTLELEPRFGYIMLTSEPEGATVRIIGLDGKVVARGTTPFHSPRLKTGAYRGELELELYELQSLDVKVPQADRLVALPLAKLKPHFVKSDGEDFVEVVRERLARPAKDVPMELFESQTLKKLAEQISKAESLRVTVDLQAIKRNRVSEDQTIYYAPNGNSLVEALETALQPLGLVITPVRESNDAWRIEITDPWRLDREKTSTVVYNVRDLVGRVPDYDRLIDAIQSNIAPSEWQEVGGRGSIAVASDLRALTITNTWHVHREVADYLANLRQAKLTEERSNAPLPASATVALGMATRQLDFTGTDVRDVDLAELPELPKVTFVQLRNTEVSGAGLKFLGRLPELRAVDLENCPIGNHSLAFLDKNTKLASLKLSRTGAKGEAVSGLGKLVQLHHLWLDETGVTDADLENIARCRALNSLSLAATDISDVGIARLAGHPQLYRLDLDRTRVTDACVEHLLSLPRLGQVSLPSGCTEAAVARLAEKRGLFSLILRDLRVSDAVIDALNRSPTLQSVMWLGESVTDEALPMFAQLEKPMTVYFVQTKVTEDGLKSIRAKAPRLKVYCLDRYTGMSGGFGGMGAEFGGMGGGGMGGIGGIMGGGFGGP